MDHTMTIVLDVALLTAGVVTALVVWRSSASRFSTGLVVACVGLFTLGAVHLSETLLDVSFDFVGRGAPENVHRWLVLGGFVLLSLGLSAAGRELRKEKDNFDSSHRALATAYRVQSESNEELRERDPQLQAARMEAPTDGLKRPRKHNRF